MGVAREMKEKRKPTRKQLKALREGRKIRDRNREERKKKKSEEKND
jgi:hypothetical protein